MSNFHPLKVVGCGSETQLQVCEITEGLIYQRRRPMATIITKRDQSDQQVTCLTTEREVIGLICDSPS